MRDEGGAGGEVDIGIEGEGQHESEAGQGVNVREPVVARRPAGGIAQRGLYRPADPHQVAIGISEDIAGRGERQDKQPFEQAPAGKAVHGHQPGRRHGEGQDEQAGEDQHADCAKEIAGQQRVADMVPGFAATKDQPCDQRRGNRHGNDKARQKGGPVTCADGKAAEGKGQGQMDQFQPARS